MSIRLMAQVWETDLEPSQKLVMLSLADNANDQGVCWPSVANMVRKTGLSERTVQGVLAQLQELGHVTRQDRPGRSTIYSVHPRAQDTPAAIAPPQQLRSTPATTAPHPRSHCTQNHQVTIKESPIPPNPPGGRAFDPSQVEGLDQDAWREWLAYRAKRKPAIKPASMEKAAQAMARLGGQQQLAVDHSIAAGYQGLIVPKEATHATRSPGHRPTRHDQLTAHLAAELEVDPVLEGHARPVRHQVGRELRLAASADVGHAALRAVGS
jgi:hypothetical protein